MSLEIHIKRHFHDIQQILMHWVQLYSRDHINDFWAMRITLALKLPPTDLLFAGGPEKARPGRRSAHIPKVL